MAKVRFNPYRLRLSIKKLHIGDRDTSDPFVDIRHILLRVSWSSLFRLAPVVSEVAVDHPAFHIVRTDEQRFNFSDLLESSGPTPLPTPTPSAPAKPQRFAVSNIQIHEGEVHFDDKVLKGQHVIKHLELDVPFIANLPADVNIFVQPLLQMVIDGSLVRITGKAKPFAVPPESVVDLNLHQFGLPLYVGYVPVKLPVKIPQGMLSSRLQVHFVNAASAPEIRVSGEMALDLIDVRDSANAPIAGFKHMSMVLTELKPLEHVTHLGKVYLDGLMVHVVRNPDGTINLVSLGASKPAPGAAVAQGTPSPAVAKPAAMPSPRAAKLRLRRAKPDRRDDRRPGGGRHGCHAVGAAKPGGCTDGGGCGAEPRGGKDGRRGAVARRHADAGGEYRAANRERSARRIEHAATSGAHSPTSRSQRRIA